MDGISWVGALWIGALVMLRDEHGDIYPSRVESIDDDALTVAKPIGIPAAYPYPVGARFDILWTDPTGLHALPAVLSAASAEAPVRLWRLAPTGEPSVEQRREFARVPVFGRVTVAAHDDDPFAADRHGYLVDMSEAAIAASVWSGPNDPVLAVGAEVDCSFTARGTTFHRTGVVHSARASTQDGEMWVVIVLAQTEAEAKALRREVFAAQIDMRRSWQQRSAGGGPEVGVRH